MGVIEQETMPNICVTATWSVFPGGCRSRFVIYFRAQHPHHSLRVFVSGEDTDKIGRRYVDILGMFLCSITAISFALSVNRDLKIL